MQTADTAAIAEVFGNRTAAVAGKSVSPSRRARDLRRYQDADLRELGFESARAIGAMSAQRERSVKNNMKFHRKRVKFTTTTPNCYKSRLLRSH